MDTTFTFRTDRYDFWPIYEAIKEYYPIGLERLAEHSIYFQYPGIKRLEELVVDNLHNEVNYRERWVKFIEEWQRELEVTMVGTTYGQAPSFSAYLEVSKTQVGEYILSRELHFAVSLIGPFYTIYGIDQSILQEEDRHYRQINRTVVTPCGGFGEYFTALRERIETAFIGYRFTPFFIHKQFIDGLRVKYQDDSRNRVYHALFNHLFTSAVLCRMINTQTSTGQTNG